MTFFILGIHPTLSIAEITAVLGKNLDYSKASQQVLLLDTHDLDATTLQNRLGGVMKIGRILGQFEKLDAEKLVHFIGSSLHQTPPEADLPLVEATGKISFGISVYDMGNAKLAAQARSVIKRAGLGIKQHVKTATGRPVRFVESKEPELSSVIVIENKLLKTGGEFVLIAAPTGLFVGKTETVQDYKAWSHRDYGRPAVDPRSGMLPPKLARIMINLSGADPAASTLLDPFCGSGTVLMEASLLGFKKIIGNDLEAKAVQDTEKNLVWLGIKGTRLLKGSAETIAQRLPDQADVIVTETYLGPPLPQRITMAAVEKNAAQLLKTYIEAFASIFKTLKPGGMCVAAFPFFVIGNESKFVPIQPSLTKMGYQILDPFPSSLPAQWRHRTPSGGLPYRRQEQRVGRDILVMRKP